MPLNTEAAVVEASVRLSTLAVRVLESAAFAWTESIYMASDSLLAGAPSAAAKDSSGLSVILFSLIFALVVINDL